MVEAACARWPRRIVVAVDAREGKVAVEGWTEDDGVDALEIGRRVARRRRGGRALHRHRRATACARARTSRRRRGWRAQLAALRR